MDKNEILEKSREDNKGVDERFLLMQQRTSYVMVSVMMVVWAVLFIWDAMHGQDTNVGSAIAMSGIATMSFCQFKQLRYKTNLAIGIITTLAALSFAIQHILGTM